MWMGGGNQKQHSKSIGDGAEANTMAQKDCDQRDAQENSINSAEMCWPDCWREKRDSWVWLVEEDAEKAEVSWY